MQPTRAARWPRCNSWTWIALRRNWFTNLAGTRRLSRPGWNAPRRQPLLFFFFFALSCFFFFFRWPLNCFVLQCVSIRVCDRRSLRRSNAFSFVRSQGSSLMLVSPIFQFVISSVRLLHSTAMKLYLFLHNLPYSAFYVCKNYHCIKEFNQMQFCIDWMGNLIIPTTTLELMLIIIVIDRQGVELLEILFGLLLIKYNFS